MNLKKALLIIMILFYIFAGYNHFANPSFYYPIIPPYLSAWSRSVNTLSGIIEIVLALMLIPNGTRKAAAWGIFIMLIAFIPSHIYFIQKGRFQLGSFEVTPFIAWFRLLVIHPVLLYWAWYISKADDIKLVPEEESSL
jgi:uncharacterized membrane protein